MSRTDHMHTVPAGYRLVERLRLDRIQVSQIKVEHDFHTPDEVDPIPLYYLNPA